MTLEFDMPFTLKELDDALSQGYDGWYSMENEDPSGDFETPYGLVEKLEEGRAYRDEYEFDTWMIIRLGNRHFKKTGYYASFDGSNWDGDLVEVEFKEVTRKEWVEV